jgi:asparagine synthase (glutamine-hydrolysing)
MCGILGVIHRDPSARVDPDRLAAARDLMTHRGPDAAGLWTRPGVGLAHRRLAILDADHGQQPAVSPDDRWVLVYNGEVYNHAQLPKPTPERSEGSDRPPDTSHCDTDALFAHLIHHGPAGLNDLNGMFALALWDQTARGLLLARDRLGQKPLYWHANDDLLIFASELQPLLAYLDTRHPLDLPAIDQFFAHGYIRSPRTIFRGIHKLPPAHTLQLDASGGGWSWQVKRYWSLEPGDVPDDPDAAIDELETLLADAVKLRMISDVPLGTLLSGGIDSAIITSLAARVGSASPTAFTISFSESAQHDELPHARAVADSVGARLVVEQATHDGFAERLEDTAAAFGEPFGNFTMFPMHQLAAAARRELTVVLSGQGADELTAGYPGRYGWCNEPTATALTHHAPPIDDPAELVQRSSFLPWAGARSKMLSPELQHQATTDAAVPRDIAEHWSRWHSLGGDRLNRVLYADVMTNLPDYLVTIEERMTMRASLEARNPFLDHRVVRYLMSCPQSLKQRGGDHKWILRQLAHRHAPATAIDRPKQGFTPPLAHWLARHPQVIREHLAEADLMTGGLYNANYQKFLLAGQYPQQMTMPVFYSLVMAVWAKRYGQYVADWPAAPSQSPGMAISGLSATPVPAARPAPAPTPWHAALRARNPEATAAGRWFCQALGNLAPGSTVHIPHDPHAWHAHLAEANGHRTTADASHADAVICTTFAALDDALAGHGGPWLACIPTLAAEQPQIAARLQTIAARCSLQGAQGVTLSETHQLLIARGVSTAPVAKAA